MSRPQLHSPHSTLLTQIRICALGERDKSLFEKPPCKANKLYKAAFDITSVLLGKQCYQPRPKEIQKRNKAVLGGRHIRGGSGGRRIAAVGHCRITVVDFGGEFRGDKVKEYSAVASLLVKVIGEHLLVDISGVDFG